MDEQIKKDLMENGVNVEGILERLPGRESLVKKLLSKFPDEQCYPKLLEAMKEKDYENAFCYAHDLKGLTANLSMDGLFGQVSALVEKLRAKKYDGVEEDLELIIKTYGQVVAVIGKLLD